MRAILLAILLTGCSTWEPNGEISLYDAVDAYCNGSSEITKKAAIQVIRYYVKPYPKDGVCGD